MMFFFCEGLYFGLPFPFLITTMLNCGILDKDRCVGFIRSIIVSVLHLYSSDLLQSKTRVFLKLPFPLVIPI